MGNARRTETTDLERHLVRMEEMLATADKEFDSKNGARGDAQTKPYRRHKFKDSYIGKR